MIMKQMQSGLLSNDSSAESAEQEGEVDAVYVNTAVHEDKEGENDEHQV